MQIVCAAEFSVGHSSKKQIIKKDLGEGYWCEIDYTIPFSEIENNLKFGNGFGYVRKISKTEFEIVTIHGRARFNHPALIALIRHPAFQRLFGITQYGACQFIEQKGSLSLPPSRIGYNRRQHSLGVLFMVLRYSLSNARQLLIEAISGLLHDSNHPIFSHSLEQLYNETFKKSFYDSNLKSHLQQCGILRLLEKYTISWGDINPKKHKMIKGAGVNADKLEYGLCAIYMEGPLETQRERLKYVEEIQNAIQYTKQEWQFHNIKTARRFADAMLWNIKHRWGWYDSYAASRVIAHIILELHKDKIITQEHIQRCLSDKDALALAEKSKNPRIKKLLKLLRFPNENFKIVSAKYFKPTFPRL
jgi:hypothetical protein